MARRRTRAQLNDGSAGAHEGEDNNENNPMQQFVNMLLGALGNRPVNNPPQASKVTFKDFKNVGPPEFVGTTEPIDAQNWIKEIEKAFDIADVGENQKTKFATYMMKDEANFWWEANKTRAGEGVIPWERFKEIFFENYFPRSMQNRMEVRFLNLKQGDMTVPQYASKFNELARFALHQVDTEERKTRRFEEGLKPWLCNKLAVFQLDNYSQLLEKAIIAEGGSEALGKFNKENNKKKNEGGTSKGGSYGERNTSNNHKRKWNGGNNNKNNKEGENKKKAEPCKVCGKGHLGKCLKGKNVCYKCGNGGHFANNYPALSNDKCFNCGAIGH